MINDAQIRQLMIQALPSLIDPAKLEVGMMDYDVSAAYWYRGPAGTLHGRTPAIHRSEMEIAAELAADLGSLFIVDALNTDVGPADTALGRYLEDPYPVPNRKIIVSELPSPYEGKRGKHPKACTCSKHKAMNGPQ